MGVNIQFHHGRLYNYSVLGETEVKSRGGITVALEVPEPWVVESLVIGDFVTKQVGRARCSHDDNYNKKTGRELALSRTKTTTLTVVGLDNVGEDRFLVLQDPQGNTYEIEKKQNYTKAHFIGYNE